jgi:ATP-dependent Lhr-like helicase
MMIRPPKEYESFFKARGWKSLAYQKEVYWHYEKGKSGLINAPTGSGKTYSLLIPIVLAGRDSGHTRGLYAIWITPLRAIAQEIKDSAEELIQYYQLDWKVAIRTGDTTPAERKKQFTTPPQILITTPESLHLIMAAKGYARFFRTLKCFVNDEWHELLSSKRAVQIELALSRLKKSCDELQIWGVSATIGNLKQAMEVLLGQGEEGVLIRSRIKRKIEVKPLIPLNMKEMKWAGNLGVQLKNKVYDVISSHKTTLVFTNTRAQTERWFQELLEAFPDLAGEMALHHGSLDREVRNWVEDALHRGVLKAVVCTSSLDLGVDFRPVEAVIQIGSPKGVSRFFQRAGRSNHQPELPSKIFFLPTHSLEVIEYTALKDSIEQRNFENRPPVMLAFDVLVQYLVTLAVSDGFISKEVLEEIRTTFSFADISDEEWNEVLLFITTGGAALQVYPDFRRVEFDPISERYIVRSRRIAMRHRMSIGTIVSDPMIRVKFLSGGFIGTVEERFLTRLKNDDHFIFSGRTLQLVQLKEDVAYVRRAKGRKGHIPAYGGGRMSLSSNLGEQLRTSMADIHKHNLPILSDLVNIQNYYSHVPSVDDLLIEVYHAREGIHIFLYPFEGRQIHEALASLLAWRISKNRSISFSLAYNDYGLELLTTDDFDWKNTDFRALLSLDNLFDDLSSAINAVEMAKRRFRDIAGIAGLVFHGFPGKKKKERYLTASSGLFFSVFNDYDPKNLLYRQAIREVYEYQIEEDRLRRCLDRLARLNLVMKTIEQPTPFCLPIMVDRLREGYSTEKIEERLKRVIEHYEKH